MIVAEACSGECKKKKLNVLKKACLTNSQVERQW